MFYKQQKKEGVKFGKRMSHLNIHRTIAVIISISKFVITTVAPVGSDKKYDAIIPIMKLTIDIATAEITTRLKDFENCIAMSVGKIIRLEIKSAPSSLIPSTITKEHIMANIVS